MTTVLRALMKFPDAREQKYDLQRIEDKVFRWLTDAGKTWDGIDYAEQNIAMKAMRVAVEHEPAYAGVDLTFLPVEPTAAQRAAAKVISWMAATMGDGLNERYRSIYEADLVKLIDAETNLPALIEHTEVLLAYCFKFRAVFAKALFPVADGKEPRDLVFDGLLLNVIEANEKSTGHKLEALKKVLREPVSQLVIARPKPPGVIQ